MDKSQHTARYHRLRQALRKARLQAQLSQDEASKKLGAYRTFINKVEAGERRIDVIELANLCKIYGVELQAFLKALGL